MNWKEELLKRESNFVLSHPSLTIIDNLEELKVVEGQGNLFSPNCAFVDPILVRNGILQKNISAEECTISNLAKYIGTYYFRNSFHLYHSLCYAIISLYFAHSLFSTINIF